MFRLLMRFPHVYAFRAPLLLAVLILFLPLLAFRTDAKPLLSGLFDVAPTGMLLITFFSFSAAWTLLLTSWLILAHGPRRLRCAPIAGVPPVPDRRWFALAGILVVPVLATAIIYSRRSSQRTYPELLLWTALGLLAALAWLWITAWIARTVPGRVPRVRRRLAAWLWRRRSTIGAGFVGLGSRGPYVLEGHGTALTLGLLTIVVAQIAGWVGVQGDIGYPQWVATLAYLLLLFLALCWLLPFLTFFFDRYRVPVLLPLALVPALTASAARSDHFYRLKDQESAASAPTPAQAIAAGRREKVIVVAATGGGIQAAAWTAEVLTRLHDACRRHGCRDSFGDAVRLISTVSGGSVGAMYFLAQYDQPPAAWTDTQLAATREAARLSSLHAVAWGLLYWDLRRAYMPWLVGVYDDRGWALERAWRRGQLGSVQLSAWRGGVQEGRRPAVIFNATSTDTGERFLFSTTSVRTRAGQTAFYNTYPGRDVYVTTAVRLSATFPYVSPVSRAVRTGVSASEPHLADGGYFDNYGMASLLDWLDAALEDTTAAGPRDVLIIQVRAGPRATPPAAAAGDTKGWFYQLYAPLAAMLAVRDSGQIAHNDTELALLTKRWRLENLRKVAITPVVFDYPKEDVPLSWHLTRTEQCNIEREWHERYADSQELRTVTAFLGSPRWQGPAAYVPSEECSLPQVRASPPR